jgi:hypothetical protein
MSEATIEIKAGPVTDWPQKLRLVADLATQDIETTLSAESARDLADVIDAGLRANAVIDRERAEAEAAVVRARQHVAQAELLGRLWAVLAIAACAVAGVILLLRA